MLALDACVQRTRPGCCCDAVVKRKRPSRAQRQIDESGDAVHRTTCKIWPAGSSFSCYDARRLHLSCYLLVTCQLAQTHNQKVMGWLIHACMVAWARPTGREQLVPSRAKFLRLICIEEGIGDAFNTGSDRLAVCSLVPPHKHTVRWLRGTDGSVDLDAGSMWDLI